MTPFSYTLLFVIMLLIWPLALYETAPVVSIILLVLNSALFVWVCWSCSTPRMSYWAGLKIDAASMMTGCANITLLIAPFGFLITYLIAVGFTVQAYFNPRRPAGPRWEKYVLKAYESRLRR